ncbi:hypothetical protein DH2020_000367 [Rehmannia glutinosa]|uniref:Uncharacterized protein n=1 Tax=Rehmannia glutinosa TaxID=99300 RepID=A0ABR0XWA8_REHGL
MGLRAARSQQEIAAMAGDILRRGDRRRGARRGGTGSAWRRRAAQFPDSAWCIPRAESSSHQDIQRAVLEASRNIVRPVSSVSSSSFRFSKEKALVENTRSSMEILMPNSCGEVGFMDEEAIFNMPVLLDSMAEGMLLTPLAMKKGFNWSAHDQLDDAVEITLWGTEFFVLAILR